MLAVGAVASTGPPPATQARRASHRLLARPQALPVAIQWPVVRVATSRGSRELFRDLQLEDDEDDVWDPAARFWRQSSL